MKKTVLTSLALSAIMLLCANCYHAVYAYPRLLFVAVPAFILVNLLPAPKKRDVPSLRMRICGHGLYLLRAFLPSACISVVYHAFLLFEGYFLLDFLEY